MPSYEKYDFAGWATRNDVQCSDGRTIRKNAFKDNDGMTVPLVWSHSHNDPYNVLGHVLLENRDEGVYAYGKFNETEQGKNAKMLVQHGDINMLSIYANKLKQSGGDVLHGAIREVSLVLASANPMAYIDSVMAHGEESDEEAIICSGEEISLEHADTEKEITDSNSKKEEESKGTKSMADENKDKTIKQVYDAMSEEQKTVVHALVGAALEEGAEPDDEDVEHGEDFEGGNEEMKHNVFDNESTAAQQTLSHSDMNNIIELAKNRSVGTLQNAFEAYAEENETLAHNFEDPTALFPEYKDLRPGAPELVTRDQTWVSTVMSGASKTPFSRIRTRHIDATGETIKALGYKKGSKKNEIGNVKLLKRTTDPQTIYVKDKMHRDDILDITEFDAVQYLYNIMNITLKEEIATAILIGDGREEGDEAKISEDHIRSIWHDDELYTIHQDVDIAAAKKELQGTNTGANFGENYIYAEAIITASLYTREKYKGSGNMVFYCTPHLLNVMLLARDLNGRRIYESKSDLAAALNVSAIHTVEQFEGKIRTDKEQKKHKLLGIFINMKDYNIGATKGGEITRFNQFDIDFNAEKALIETRLSGALTRIKSAIVLEELQGE